MVLPSDSLNPAVHAARSSQHALTFSSFSADAALRALTSIPGHSTHDRQLGGSIPVKRGALLTMCHTSRHAAHLQQEEKQEHTAEAMGRLKHRHLWVEREGTGDQCQIWKYNAAAT